MMTSERLDKIKKDCAERVERSNLPDGEHVQFRIAAEVYVPELIEALVLTQEAAAGSSRTCSVTRQQVEYWLQEKRPDGNWFDYAKKDSLKICDTRIEELKSEKPGRTFRPIARIITDKDMSPNRKVSDDAS